MVNPPLINTVTKTMTSVQVNINCRTSVSVLRIARAKAIAPRSPAVIDKCVFSLNTEAQKGYIKLTSKHQHMLEVPADLLATSTIEEE